MYATSMYDSIHEIPRLSDVIELIRPQLGSHGSGNEPDEIRASLSAALRPGSRTWMIHLRDVTRDDDGPDGRYVLKVRDRSEAREA